MKRLLTIGGLIGVVLLVGCTQQLTKNNIHSMQDTLYKLSSLSEEDSTLLVKNLKETVQDIIDVRNCAEISTCSVDINSLEQRVKQAFGYTREILRQLLNSSLLTMMESELQLNKKRRLNINKILKHPQLQKLLDELGFTKEDVKVIKSFLKKNKKSIETDIQDKTLTRIIQEIIDAITTSLDKLDKVESASRMSAQVTWYWENLRPSLRNAGRWFVNCVGQAAWTSVVGITFGTYDVITSRWIGAETILGVYSGLKSTISTCTDESYWRINR